MTPDSAPIHPYSPRFTKNTARGGCRGTTGLSRTSTVSNLGRIVSIHSPTVVNRSTAVVNRSGTVDESCRHRRSIVRHSIDAGVSFFHSDGPRSYQLAQIGMNRSESWPESRMSD